MDYFDEEWYLLKYPDVRTAIARGEVSSGRHHFLSHGQAEGRLRCDPKLFERLLDADKLTSRVCHFDQMFVTNTGHALVLGWVDSRCDAVRSLSFNPFVGKPIVLDDRMQRYYREDVSEKKARDDRDFDHGFWITFNGISDRLGHLGGNMRVEFASGRTGLLELAAQLVSPQELRGRLLDLMGRAARSYRSLTDLDDSVGAILRELNLEIASGVILTPPVVHGDPANRPTLTVIVASRSPDRLLRQAALFAETERLEAVEFLWVGCRPATTPDVHTIADTAGTLYGLQIVSTSSTDEATETSALNHAVRLASAETVLFLGDAVIAADRNCLARSLDIASRMGDEDVIGAVLVTEGDSVQQAGLSLTCIDRVHGLWGMGDPRKGTPAIRLFGADAFHTDSAGFSAMMVRRSAFFRHGGFDESYVSLGYQDADYCLRARRAGGHVKVHPGLLFYSLEGRQAAPAQPRDWTTAAIDLAHFNRVWRSDISGALDAGQELHAALAPSDQVFA